jgi:membrane-associated protease RseP (regulator of RpoE activity)
MSKPNRLRICFLFVVLALALLTAIGLRFELARAAFDLQAPPPPQTPPSAKIKATAKAIVPFSMLPSNHMLVRAMINGKGPYRLIFDLGAPITLLSNRASETSGVVKANAPRSFLFSMRGEAEVAKLQVGDLIATKLPVIVFDHPALRVLGEVLGRPIDGIIGFTFFARYRATIDYQVNQMTFEPVEFQIRDLLKELPDRLAGPKTARRRVLAPGGLWGLRLGKPTGGLDSPGVPITEVLSSSPAALAGLKPGDVLTTIDNRWTTSIADAYAAAADAEPCRDIRVIILRDGKEQTLTVRPADGI